MEPDKLWRDTAGVAESLDRLFSCNSRDDIAAAEQVAIERGLGGAYGRWLVTEGELDVFSLLRDTRLRGQLDREALYELIGEAATVPLSARVRALVRLIEEQEKTDA
jgi:hypothetical protein